MTALLIEFGAQPLHTILPVPHNVEPGNVLTYDLPGRVVLAYSPTVWEEGSDLIIKHSARWQVDRRKANS
jgi:hypothetical protein